MSTHVWTAILGAAALWAVLRLVARLRAAAVLRRIRGAGARPVVPTRPGVFRARPWRAGARPPAPATGYHRPADLEIDENIPPPPREIDGIYGE